MWLAGKKREGVWKGRRRNEADGGGVGRTYRLGFEMVAGYWLVVGGCSVVSEGC